MTTTFITEPPTVTKIELTLVAGSKAFTHNMTSVVSAEVYSDYENGVALTSYIDAGDVATDTGNGTFTPTAEGIITAVEVEISDYGTSTIVTGTQAHVDDGTVFTDESAASLSATVNDVHVFPATPVQNDAAYFGLERAEFNKLKMLVAGTDGVYATSTPTWEYYNGSAWTALTVTDGTSGLTDLSVGTEITWASPADWTAVAINSVTAYWVRVREAHATPSFTTVPLMSQIFLGVALIVDVHVDGTTIFTNATRAVVSENVGKRTFNVSPEAGAFDVAEDITIDTDFVAIGGAPQDMKVYVYGHIVNVHDALDIERFSIAVGVKGGRVMSTNVVSTTPVTILLK